MKNTGFTLVLLLVAQTMAQNLVPNPGFESIVECPEANPGNTQIHFTEPWIPVRAVEESTSDLYNDCVFYPGNDPWEQLPFYENAFLDNPARNGISRVRIAVFASNTYNKREYIQVPLTEALEVGQEYQVQFYAKNNVEFSVAANNIGALFSTQRLSIYSIFPNYGTSATNPDHSLMLENHPQVKCDSIFTAQEDYGLIEGSFVADSAYAYMSIGIFTPDEKVDYIFLNSDGVNRMSLVIDDVSVVAANVGLAEPQKIAWELYASEGMLYVKPQKTVQELRLYDLLGRQVLKQQQELPLGGQSVLTLPALPNGLYLCKLFNANGQALYSHKIMLH